MDKESAVLLITFNRVDNTKEVLKQIRKAKIKKLFVANDGPRVDNKNDQRNREEIKNLISEIDWECELHTNFQDDNLGCGLGVSTAINWAFNYEDRLIILEDDCVPSLSFFSYCNELLEKYKNDLRIWQICGLNHFEGSENLNNRDSYFFSKYGSIWGWATWKDRWKKFSLEKDIYQEFIADNYIFDHVTKEESARALMIFDNFYKKVDYKKPQTWDYQWGFITWANRGIRVVPASNLIKNIGEVGAHAKGVVNNAHLLDVNEEFVINKHPNFFQTNYLYDNEFYRVFRKKKNVFTRIMLRILKILKI